MEDQILPAKNDHGGEFVSEPTSQPEPQPVPQQNVDPQPQDPGITVQDFESPQPSESQQNSDIAQIVDNSNPLKKPPVPLIVIIVLFVIIAVAMTFLERKLSQERNNQVAPVESPPVEVASPSPTPSPSPEPEESPEPTATPVEETPIPSPEPEESQEPTPTPIEEIEMSDYSQENFSFSYPKSWQLGGDSQAPVLTGMGSRHSISLSVMGASGFGYCYTYDEPIHMTIDGIVSKVLYGVGAGANDFCTGSSAIGPESANTYVLIPVEVINGQTLKSVGVSYKYPTIDLDQAKDNLKFITDSMTVNAE